jgi:putative ABC transport system permease protein
MRAAIRNLLRTPKFTIFVVVLLTLGIAVNTTMFTIVRAVLLRQLPFRNPDRLVWIWATRTDRDKSFFSIPNFIDTRDTAASLVELSAFANWAVNLTGSGEAERLQGVRVSPNAFEMLGVQPAAGRLIATSDAMPGTDRVVVISHGLWQRRFGANSAVIGSNVLLNGESFQVIGVLPPEFTLPNAEMDIASPLVFETDPRRTERGSNFLRVFGRVKEGISVERTHAALVVITERLRLLFPDENAKHTAPRVHLLAEEMVGTYRTSLWTLFASVGMVLAIACANLANLVVARSASRRKEMAIRVALGALRGHLALQVWAECVLLAVVGGAGGLTLAWWLVGGVAQITPIGLPRASEIAMDWEVFLFTAALTLLTASALAVGPMVTAGRGNLIESLKSAVRDRSDSFGRTGKSALVVVEVALSVVLMIGAGLLIRSFIRLQSVTSGVVADHVLVTRLSLPPTKYSSAPLISQFVSRLIETIHSPAAVTSAVPLSGINSRTDFIVRGHPPAKVEDTPGAQTRWISSDYFKVMGIPLIRGRQFDSFDRQGAEAVAVVDEALEQRFIPQNDSAEQSLIIDFGDGKPPWSLKIVGVVGNVKHFGLDDAPTPTIYFPLDQVWPSALPAVTIGMTVVVKTPADPLEMADALRRMIASVDADVATSTPATMNKILASTLAPRHFNTLLMEGFAGAGLLLAMIGLYAVLSYAVAQTRYEIAIRMALGAAQGNVLRMVMLQGMKLSIVGSAIGLVATSVLSRAIRGMLYQTQTIDMSIYLVTAVLLQLVTAVASYVPAAKAASTDPMKTLRGV